MTQSRLKVLIIGLGYTGSYIARLLLSQGHRVVAVRRSTADSDIANLRLIRYDMCDPINVGLPCDFNELDAAVYVLASDQYSSYAYRRAYSMGIRRLIDMLRKRRRPLHRLLYVSSSSVFAQTAGGWVDAHSQVKDRGSHFSARWLLDGEHACFTSELPATVIRFSGIYGPQRTKLLHRTLERLRVGELLSDCPDQYTNRIHVEDCAGVVAHALNRSEPQRLYLASDCAPVNKRCIHEWLAKRCGFAPPRYSLDVLQNTAQARLNKRCDNRSLLEEGYRFRYPDFKTGYQDYLTEYKQTLQVSHDDPHNEALN